MNMKLSLQAVLLTVGMTASAQQVATSYKSVNNGNPISASVFCADPTAIDYNGRLYVYGSNDHQQFKANNKKGDNGYGAIKSLVVFSTDDMVNWTFHGTIDVGKLCSSWGWQFSNSWAPSAVWRTTAAGKDEFFVYFANGGGSVGVLKSTESPVGPFTSPRTNPMITGSTAGVSPCNWVFDPGVVIDSTGTAWIGFGGGDPNNQGNDLQPNNARFAKLATSMTSISGKAVKIPAPYHFEASELNIMDGKFVYTYCSSWRGRNDWSKYQKEHNITVGAPGTCTMCYMVSDNPMDPNSWVYKGDYGPHPGSSPNNHSHLHKFQGNYYHIYHNGALLQNMKNANGVDNSAGGYRSICVNKATVNESTQKINKVTLNNSGVSAIKNLDPYILQQAETMATCGGVTYDNFTNITKKTNINSLGNDASQNMQVKMNAGAWTMVRKADFGEDGPGSFMLRAKGTGVLEIRLGSQTAKPAARLEFSSTAFEDHILDIDTTAFTGVKSVFFVFTEAKNVQFDAWQFQEKLANDIHHVSPNAQHPSSTTTTRRFDLSGRQLPNTRKQHGLVIEQRTEANGVKTSRKRAVK